MEPWAPRTVTRTPPAGFPPTSVTFPLIVPRAGASTTFSARRCWPFSRESMRVWRTYPGADTTTVKVAGVGRFPKTNEPTWPRVSETVVEVAVPPAVGAEALMVAPPRGPEGEDTVPAMVPSPGWR